MAPPTSVWLFGLVGLALGSSARADDASIPVRLELTGPPGCASVRDVLSAIQRRNGRVRLAAGSERAASLVVTLRASEDGLHGDLRVHSDDGSDSVRGVEGATCQAVVEALSLTAALALESLAFTAPAPTASAAAPVAPKARDAEPVPAAPAAPARRPSPLRLEAGAQASLSQMVAPHLNAGGGLLGRARFERGQLFSPSLTLSVLHTRNELFESSRHAAVHLTGVSLSACPIALTPASRLRLEPCLTATGAELAAFGRDLPLAQSVSRSWWGVGALGRVAFAPLPDFALEVEGGALLPLVDRRFVVEPSGTSLGDTPAVAPFASAGLVYAL